MEQNRHGWGPAAAITHFFSCLGLTAGWYGNNCICRELRLRKMAEAVYEGDVRATLNFGFDGIKFDFCGEFLDLDKYAGLFNRSGQRVAIENSHWGYTVPSFDRSGTKHCPYHFFRTSVDIKNTWRSVMHNLASTTKFSDKDRLDRAKLEDQFNLFGIINTFS